MDRFKVDELERRVDEVLFYKWDPVGVNHYVSARAEYRSYVPAVLEKLKAGDREGVFGLLKGIQVESMGEEFDSTLASSVVDLLFDHKEAIELGHA
ncbi:hypothetical protein [Saccharospirillum salsuginis]|uniref:Uncharacterized protein n=1 Tax=Saccharospirillum salsuginis TaxID=418750 RepID=A0A918K007_9GAMM|nr:hypothetical protein [Saccharospirillum salsuginis]GGX39950.1 hypothetical protein GCM10007392_03140 [Saccharospirillum salsuginis]